MKHYIITNRQVNKDDSGKEYINPDGEEMASDNLRFAEYDDEKRLITLYPDIPIGEIVDYGFSIKGKKSDELLGTACFFSNLYKDMCKSTKRTKKTERTEGNDTLLFIHGFNNDLEDVLGTIKTLKEKYINNKSPIARIVMFTCPSNGDLREYRDDQRDA